MRTLVLVLGLSLALAGCRAAGPSSGRSLRTAGAEAPAPREHLEVDTRVDGPPLEVPPLRAGEAGVIVRCAKVICVDDEDRVFAPGVVVIRDGRIEGIARTCNEPEGFEVLDYPRGWAAPGYVDLHTHIQAGARGGYNDMVYIVNPDLRSSPTLEPANEYVWLAIAGGVTTLFGIPGSGTAMGGFGILYKTKQSGGYDDVVMRDPGGLKVAQTHNPERFAAGLGSTWSGLSWQLENVNDRALRAIEEGRKDLVVENLMKVHNKELPVLIHTAGNEGVANTVRMWKGRYDTNCIVSHGSFDGWKAARYVADMGVPVNHGPRIIDYYSSREGRIVPSSSEYVDAGVPLFSLNTDSGVIPEEELFLQGSMSARFGANSYEMLRAVTINPAKAFGIDDRVGSLEIGKDADLVIYNGSPLDPRSRVETVLIEGVVEYDRERDGQRF